MKCLLCSNSIFKNSIFGGYYYKGIRYFLKRCRKCGFIFIDPIPDKEAINSFYTDNNYFLKYYPKDKCDCNLEEEVNILFNIRDSGRILDIGSANGNFLRIAKKKRYEVYGIEPNAMMAEFVRKEYNIQIINSYLRQNLFPEKYFDIIRFSDVLEHLRVPDTALEIAKLYLKDDGLLVVSQPLTYNRSLFNFILAIKMSLRRSKFSSNNPPYHLWEFIPSTLENFLDNNGFGDILFKKVYESEGNLNHLSPSVRLVRKFSCFFSNSYLFRFLKLGNRMLILARKG